MKITRTAALLLGSTALAAGVLTGCSSAANQAPASEVNISGTPVSAKDDITALCKSIVEQKLPQEAAAAMAESSGYTSRVIKIDGKDQPATADLREDRMNFEVKADIVVACTAG